MTVPNGPLSGPVAIVLHEDPEKAAAISARLEEEGFIVSRPRGGEAAMDALRRADSPALLVTSAAFHGALRVTESEDGPSDPEDREARSRSSLEREFRKQEDRLRESEENYRQLFELESDALFLIDNETGSILQANRAASLLYGHTPEELLAMRNTDLSDEETQTRAVTRSTPPEPDEVVNIPLRWHRKKDGTRFPVEITGRFFIHRGRSTHIAAIRDITSRLEAEEELRRQSFFFEQVFMQSSISTQILDKDGWCERINQKLSELFGVAPNHMEGRVYNIFKDEGIRQGGVLPYLEKVFGEGKATEWEVNFDIGVAAESQDIEVAEKRKAWFRNWAYPIFDPDGQLTHVIIQHVDITERKREEEEKEKLQAQFLQSQKMESVGRLAGGVAHDFNNMLSVILGHAEMALDRTDPSSPITAELKEIRAAAQRSAELTRQLLAFARMQTVAPKLLDLNDAAGSTLTLLRRLVGENIELVWVPGASLWPVKIDTAQLDQILANLTVNARDAISGGGHITLETKNVVVDEAACVGKPDFRVGDFVRLTFRDDGCGMDPETLAHLFEPFFTTKDLGRGTGLGLATVYGIVSQNGGFLDVESSPDEGATFRVFLPRASGDPTQVSRTNPDRPPLSRGETVLLVEDEEAVLTVGRSMLESLGYNVLTAGGPADAIRRAEAHEGEIHLLLADVVMPEMDGRQVAAQIKGRRPGLKCLFMSGYPADVIADHGVLDEGIQFLPKPFTAPALAAAVRRALDAG